MIGEYNNNKICKIITHNDSDGVANIILAWLAFGKDNVDYEICSCDEVNKQVNTFVEAVLNKEQLGYSYFFITDLSVDKENAEYINKLIDISSDENSDIDDIEIALLDHHANLEWLNDGYKWATVLTRHPDESKSCGASLFKYYLESHGNLIYPKEDTLVDPYVSSYVELVRLYDTWDWKKDLNYPESDRKKAKQLNDCLKIVGIDEFIEKIYQMMMVNMVQLIYSDFELPGEWVNILKYKRREIEAYIENAQKNTIRFETKEGKKGMFLICDRYDCTSELGDAILKTNEDINFVAMFYPLGIALRSRTKEEFDCSKLAKLSGGGGHEESAGFRLDENVLINLCNKIFWNQLVDC